MNTKFLSLGMMLMLAFSLAACDSQIETGHEDPDMGMEEEWSEEEMEAMEDEMHEDLMTYEVELMTFNQADYEAALAEGKDVFLDFFASWCPTCQANSPELEAALSSVTNDNLLAFRVDYDDSDDLQAAFSVLSQSTYILIPGGEVESFVTLGPGLFDSEDFSEFVN